NCAIFNRNFCHLDKKLRPYCPAECLTLLSSSLYNRHIERSHLGDFCINGEMDSEIRIKQGKAEIPKWYSIDYT
ncbi:MAG: hypothetical protein ACRC0X_03435, partial [Brevinema sp.]